MATLQNIRSKGPLLVIVIGLALFAFIAGDAWKVMQPHQAHDVGEVNGDALSAQEYQNLVEEYPIVVMPVLMTHYVMLQRNLIYTGITRAKKICVLVGQTKALAYAIHNMKVLKRNTRLKERLAPVATDSAATAPNSARQYALPTEEIQMAAEERVQYGDKEKP